MKQLEGFFADQKHKIAYYLDQLCDAGFLGAIITTLYAGIMSSCQIKETVEGGAYYVLHNRADHKNKYQPIAIYISIQVSVLFCAYKTE